MDQILPWLVSLGSGALGGNLAGAVLKNFSLGTLGNSLAGILGGGIGMKLLAMLGVIGASTPEGGGLDMTSILENLGSGAAGGGVLVTLVGMLKKAFGSK